nr:hypothetical protein 1634Bnrm2_p102 [Cryptomonas sp.]
MANIITLTGVEPAIPRWLTFLEVWCVIHYATRLHSCTFQHIMITDIFKTLNKYSSVNIIQNIVKKNFERELVSNLFSGRLLFELILNKNVDIILIFHKYLIIHSSIQGCHIQIDDRIRKKVFTLNSFLQSDIFSGYNLIRVFRYRNHLFSKLTFQTYRKIFNNEDFLYYLLHKIVSGMWCYDVIKILDYLSGCFEKLNCITMLPIKLYKFKFNIKNDIKKISAEKIKNSTYEFISGSNLWEIHLNNRVLQSFVLYKKLIFPFSKFILFFFGLKACTIHVLFIHFYFASTFILENLFIYFYKNLSNTSEYLTVTRYGKCFDLKIFSMDLKILIIISQSIEVANFHQYITILKILCQTRNGYKHFIRTNRHFLVISFLKKLRSYFYICLHK